VADPEEKKDDEVVEAGPAGRPPLPCPRCGGAMRFEDGQSTVGMWAERYRCGECGAVSYRSYGRGSV
jgi:transposase-like protein